MGRPLLASAVARPGRALRALVLVLLPLSAAADLETPVDEAIARQWLARMNAAANERSYRGTMVFTADGQVSSSRVAHSCVGDQFIERVEALDGPPRRVYRHNAVVHTVWPLDRLVVVERRQDSAGLVSTHRTVEPRALSQYDVRAHGRQRVAGRSASVLLLQPRDTLRFAQRLWADEETGLLLRSEVLGDKGRVLESSAFSDVEIGTAGSTEQLLDGIQPAGYRVENSPDTVVDLHAEGWSLGEQLPGFTLMGCLKRALPGNGQSRLHAVYSDGLTFVSLFIEPFDESRHTRALVAEMGATHTLMQRVGAHWVTAMGDVPRRTLERFVASLRRSR